MQRYKEFNDEMVLMYNHFVFACNHNKLLLEKCDIKIGYTKDNEVGLEFDFTISNGMSDETANKVFERFIKDNPTCSIRYNLPPEQDELTKALHRVSETVLFIGEGFKLEVME